MEKKWEEAARAVLAMNGLKTDPEIEQAFWKSVGTDADAHLDLSERGGDIISLMVDGAEKILKEAKGKSVYAIPERENWDDLTCFFGEKNEILARIKES